MRKPPILLLILSIFLGSGIRAFAAEPQSWEFRSGKYWEQVKAAASQPSDDPTLTEVERKIAGKQYRAAKREALTWVKVHKKSANRDRGLYLLAVSNYFIGDRIESYYEFDELLDLYPDSPLFNASLEHQFDIADGYLNGYKRKFLGLSLFGAEDEGVEMLYRIQQRSPGSQVAEKSLLRTGDYYYKSSDFDLAGDVYASYVRSYPRSPEKPRVQLRQAFSYYAQFRGLKFDATPIIDAREKLAAIMLQYPKLAEEENLAPVIARIDETFARKLYLTGDFYVRTHEPRAAVYTWRYLIQTYPQSYDAEVARKELAKMPKSALNEPPPPAGGSAATPTVDVR